MASKSDRTVQQVKFVEHDAAGLPVKRKQTHQACATCRKRKRRCTHHERTVPVANVGAAPNARAQDDGDDGIGSDRDASDAATQLLRFFHHASDKASLTNSTGGSETQHSRQHMEPAPPFLGDLNPEAILVEATMPPESSTMGSRTDGCGDDQVPGVLSPASPGQTGLPPVRSHHTANTNGPSHVDEEVGSFFSVLRGDGTRLTIPVHDTSMFTAHAQTLVNRRLADKVLPSGEEWQAMRDLYLTKIHPIFPIYEKSTLMQLPDEADLRELIKASVCLAAATDPEARSLLSFNKTPQPGKASTSRVIVPFDEYAREMANFITRRLSELHEKQSLPLIRKIQVMAITCLYWQPANPSERFEPIYLFSRLVTLAHTHGVHLGLLVRTDKNEQQDAEGSQQRLFKCLYALDRLLAAFAGRPVMFHNEDLIQLPGPDERDPPSFRLFMSLILLLDQVIEMYRPHPKVTYIDVPVFERLAIDAEAQTEPEGILATLEVLYHAICVLSVRMPRDRFRTAPECDAVPGPRYQHLPPSGVNARRSHSADRILDVIKDYKLSPMPFVPYALTLSLSVAYRKWRFSQLPMFRTRGGADFKKVLPVLKKMGSIWSSARINGQLGQAVMLKLDRTELLNKKRAKSAAQCGEDTGVERGQTVVRGEPGNQDMPAAVRSRTELPSAPTTSGESVELSEGEKEPQVGRYNSLPEPPPRPREAIPSSSTNPALDRRQKSPPVATTTVSAIASQVVDNNCVTDNWRSLFHNRDPSKTSFSRENLVNRSGIASQDGYGQLDNAIPVPGDQLVDTQIPTDDMPSTNAWTESSLNGFPIDDDALFRAWDPRFAQSVDFSFSSILDLGNPFAWPEYRHYTS